MQIKFSDERVDTLTKTKSLLAILKVKTGLEKKRSDLSVSLQATLFMLRMFLTLRSSLQYQRDHLSTSETNYAVGPQKGRDESFDVQPCPIHRYTWFTIPALLHSVMCTAVLPF